MIARAPELSAPAWLAPEHELDEFTSGIEPLDDWLKRHAHHNEAEGGSRTFVVCAGKRVVGYFSLAAGSVIPGAATGRARRNMPNPVPVVLPGRPLTRAGREGASAPISCATLCCGRLPPGSRSACGPSWCMPSRRKPRLSMRSAASGPHRLIPWC